MQQLEFAYQVSERKACNALGFTRSSHRYKSIADRQDFLRMRLKDLASARVNYGYLRLHILLQREGWQVNHKRVYRLYMDFMSDQLSTGHWIRVLTIVDNFTRESLALHAGQSIIRIRCGWGSR